MHHLKWNATHIKNWVLQFFFFLLKESSWFCTEKDCRCFLFYTLSLPLSSALDFVHDVGFVTCMLLQGVRYDFFCALDCTGSAIRLSEMQLCKAFFFFFFYLPFLNDLRWENLWASCSSNCDLVQRLSWSAFRSLCLSPGALIMSFYSFAICLTACFCDRHERMSLAQGLIKLSKNRYEIIYANQSRSKMAFFPPLYVPACLHPD